jgi:hypothetical protein
MRKILASLQQRRLFENHQEKRGVISVHNGYSLLFAFNLFLLLAALIFMQPQKLPSEFLQIMFSESHLVTDYVALTSVGGGLFNATVMTFVAIIICYHYRVPVTGGMISAVFMVTGYGFFGKNLFNFIPIFLGVRLYSYLMNQPLKKYLLIALYGSSVSPIVSFFAFNESFTYFGLFIGYPIGILTGLIMVPLALHFQALFKKVSIYSAGFTSGMICTMVAGICRMFGFDIELRTIVSQSPNLPLVFLMVALSLLMIVYGLVMAIKRKRLNMRAIWSHSGQIEYDILRESGVYNTMINMGLMGILLMSYVSMIGVTLNGPIVGAMFCVIGFSACGAHVFNALPLFAGVLLANMLNIYAITETVTVTAAIFAMMLCAVTNAYGWKGGMIVGFIHTSMVLNIDVLHGGLNLYNNGFSGGLVAMMIIPLLDFFQQVATLSLNKKDKKKRKKETAAQQVTAEE